MKPRVPLMAKVAGWLVVHLLVLAAAFFIFIAWQLELGLDSLLTGSTGVRLKSLGNEISAELGNAPESEWDAIISGYVSPYGLEGFLRTPEEMAPGKMERGIPGGIIERVKKEGPPGPERRPGPPGPRMDDRGGPGPPEMRRDEAREAKVLFLTKDKRGGNYWAVMEIPLSGPGRGRPLQGVLFLKSDNASAGGLFFDYRPWLFGGLAVLVLSIILWTPFVLGITRYAGRISKATARIAEGDFDAKIGARRSDELGRAGDSIEEMSARLGHLISGQRRFLGDVAHELCAPLARMRTGLGILQNSVDGKQSERLESIEEDAEELSVLVSELLAFTKANSASVAIEDIDLPALLGEIVSRELGGHEVEMSVPPWTIVKADRRFLTRALVNILRNCHRHGGADCKVRICATSAAATVSLSIEDDGPGAPEAELARLFEPFYRPDRSRTRETGGTGLGMAIVESSIRACGGKVFAESSPLGGLMVGIILLEA